MKQSFQSKGIPINLRYYTFLFLYSSNFVRSWIFHVNLCKFAPIIPERILIAEPEVNFKEESNNESITMIIPWVSITYLHLPWFCITMLCDWVLKKCAIFLFQMLCYCCGKLNSGIKFNLNTAIAHYEPLSLAGWVKFDMIAYHRRLLPSQTEFIACYISWHCALAFKMVFSRADFFWHWYDWIKFDTWNHCCSFAMPLLGLIHLCWAQ